MHPVHHAAQTPDKPAVVMAGSGKSLSYAALNGRSNQVAHLLRSHGLTPGDAIAVLLDNCPDYFEIAWGAQRAGLYFTCLSTKLQVDEIAYILTDSHAKVLFVGANLLALAEEALAHADIKIPVLVIGDEPQGHTIYSKARDAQPNEPIADESAGADMLYSSGTTGRPKGIKIPLTGAPIDTPNALQMMAQAIYGISADSQYLSPAPLYHAAPLRWCMSVHKIGGTVVVMEKFEPETYLATVERHRITDSQLVPTMFVRMLKLEEGIRKAYDLSSLKMAVHAAAPCPVTIKEQMMAWWGPIIHEYYAGTEGNGFCTIGPQDWLRKKGSVGKALLGELRIVGEAGEVVPTKAFMIISGGVNIYPQESENILVTHPKVADVAVFGVPNEEFGEEVKAVVQPMDMADAGPELEAELLAFCRASISHVKAPRSIDFMAELPRYPTGKLYKRLLRDRYWAGRESKLV